jgi:hypothetical protein
MGKLFLGLGFAVTLLLALALISGIGAQPGPQGPPFGKKGAFPRAITVDQIVERIMSFDKNKDGKITADELPERMQHLVALGDVNKDGALDKDEVRKLATTLQAFAALTSSGGPGGGRPPGAGRPKKGFAKGAPFRNAAGEVQRTLDDLDVSGPTRKKAGQALRAYQDKLRRFEVLARAELILQMKDLLTKEDYSTLKSALDRPPGGPPGFQDAQPTDNHSRIDQLQKELDELRRKLPK